MGLAGVPCPCVEWLQGRPAAEADIALDTVIGHLCDMRHSLVHESWPVIMVAYDAPEATCGTSMSDIYPCGEHLDLFRMYTAGITLGRFKAICSATAMSCLNATYS